MKVSSDINTMFFLCVCAYGWQYTQHLQLPHNVADWLYIHPRIHKRGIFARNAAEPARPVPSQLSPFFLTVFFSDWWKDKKTAFHALKLLVSRLFFRSLKTKSQIVSKYEVSMKINSCNFSMHFLLRITSEPVSILKLWLLRINKLNRNSQNIYKFKLLNSFQFWIKS